MAVFQIEAQVSICIGRIFGGISCCKRDDPVIVDGSLHDGGHGRGLQALQESAVRIVFDVDLSNPSGKHKLRLLLVQIDGGDTERRKLRLNIFTAFQRKAVIIGIHGQRGMHHTAYRWIQFKCVTGIGHGIESVVKGCQAIGQIFFEIFLHLLFGMAVGNHSQQDDEKGACHNDFPDVSGENPAGIFNHNTLPPKWKKNGGTKDLQ